MQYISDTWQNDGESTAKVIYILLANWKYYLVISVLEIEDTQYQWSFNTWLMHFWNWNSFCV